MSPNSAIWYFGIGVLIVIEELAFRSYLQRRLLERVSLWSALALQALVFAAWGHFVSPAIGGFGISLVLGVYLGSLRNVRGDVWTGIGVRTVLLGVEGVFRVETIALPESVAGFAQFAVVGVLIVTYIATNRLTRRNPESIYRRLTPRGSTPRRSAHGQGLIQRGIMYDTGVAYGDGEYSFDPWDPALVRNEIASIRNDLNCNAVTIIGDDFARIRKCAEIARDADLEVWIQPRVVDVTPDVLLERLADAADMAEDLRRTRGDVYLNIGCEFTLFVSGSIPGSDFGERHKWLRRLWILMPIINARLNRLLGRAVRVARARFGGCISYGAGAWETVDWSRFDIIGLDYYLDSYTWSWYLEGLRRHYRYRKPVIIAEFGCCAYQGAQWEGGGGGWIEEWSDGGERRVPDRYRRDESVQATYIERLINLFAGEGLHGAFVCMYAERNYPTSDDPTRDLDVASLGIMKAMPDGTLEPKEAFTTIAEAYRRHVESGAEGERTRSEEKRKGGD